jgi:hypothetical protein
LIDISSPSSRYIMFTMLIRYNNDTESNPGYNMFPKNLPIKSLFRAKRIKI